jgi:hypothetical protein
MAQGARHTLFALPVAFAVSNYLQAPAMDIVQSREPGTQAYHQVIGAIVKPLKPPCHCHAR